MFSMLDRPRGGGYKLMAKDHVYCIDKVAPNKWYVTKYRASNPMGFEEGMYVVEPRSFKRPNPNHLGCSCMAGSKYTCRHRQMVAVAVQAGLANSGKRYYFEEGKWL
jgi:hypothetical protein